MARGMYEEAHAVSNLILSETKRGNEEPAVVMHAVASIWATRAGVKGSRQPGDRQWLIPNCGKRSRLRARQMGRCAGS
jgi:hypothetical protein